MKPKVCHAYVFVHPELTFCCICSFFYLKANISTHNFSISDGLEGKQPFLSSIKDSELRLGLNFVTPPH